jgi:hypothetical protein
MKTYGELSLSVTSPEQQFQEPLDLMDLKTFLKLDPEDESEDAMLDSFITMARSIAEIEQGKDLIEKEYDYHLDFLVGDDLYGAVFPIRYAASIFNFGVDAGIQLRYPLNSVDLFTITDLNGAVTTLTQGYNADYRVDLNRARVLPPWGKIWPFYTPDVSSSVLIRFNSGYSSMHPFWRNQGATVMQGMRLLISDLYENRVPPESRYSPQGIPQYVLNLLRYGARPHVH